MNTTPDFKTRQRGFTLIEVLIAVAIVGVLSAIAIPSYTAYIERSHRAEARNFLVALSQRMEQNYSLSGNYNTLQNGADVTDDFIDRAGMGTVPPGPQAQARYNISFVPGQLLPGTFTLRAVPVNAQRLDRCGTLLINQQGLRGANNILNNRAPLTLECWGR